MAYSPPSITSAGLLIPSFEDILLYFQDQFRILYGPDVVLDNSTQDGQWLAIMAKASFDSMQALQNTYLQFSPTTATDAGLSNVVKINGLTRNSASYSTVAVTLTGVANTQINNGIVQDTITLTRWNLPTTVTIGALGTVTVTATAQVIGSIVIQANTVTRILTPQTGWTSVTNALASNPGLAIETDAQLRVRQALSVAQPSQSILEGLLGALLDLTGVSQAVAYENQTNSVDITVTPNRQPHSIAVVVAGGSDTQIANTIYTRKTLGTNSAGFVPTVPNTVTVNVSGPDVAPLPITFYRPSIVTINVSVIGKQKLNYVNQTANDIAQQIVLAINALNIGEDVIRSKLFVAANNTAVPQTYDITSILLTATGKTPTTEGNITINDNEESFTAIANVTVTITP